MVTRARRPSKSAYHHGDLRAGHLDVARRLVEEKGAASFSLREAARFVGVDPAASYRHFRDRGEVLIALAQEGFADLAGRFSAERGKPHPPRQPAEILAGLAQNYLSFALEQPAIFRLMFGETGLPSTDPRLRSPQVERGPYQQLLDVSEQHLRAIGRSEDPSALANVLWAAAHGGTRLIIDGALPLSESDARALVSEATEAVLQRSARDPSGGRAGPLPTKKRRV